MKRVLITGAGSYVGGWVRRRLEREPGRFFVEELDVQDGAWREFDFSSFDVVYHVAGIAHVSTDPSMEDLYYRVNRDLAIEVARHAKSAGVGQFVFMSSSIVYGDSDVLDAGPITADTPANPANFYGRSKLEAEKGLDRSEVPVVSRGAQQALGALRREPRRVCDTGRRARDVRHVLAAKRRVHVYK